MYLKYINFSFDDVILVNERTLVVKNNFASDYLADLKLISSYLKNAALAFDYSSALPKTEAEKDLNLWALGPLENMAVLHKNLAANGLVYLENFAYNIKDVNSNTVFPNFDFLFNKEGRKVTQVTPFQQFESLDLTKDFGSLFWLNLTAKGGYQLSYVPQSVRISPPFLSWDKEQGIFTVISGATAGKVKVDGTTEFGKKFKAKFNLIDGQK